MEYEQLKERLVFKPDKVELAAPDKLVGVKHEEKPCEDCGTWLEKPRQVNIHLQQTPLKHWSVHCLYCGLYKNPNTGSFNCTNAEKRAILKDISQKRNK